MICGLSLIDVGNLRGCLLGNLWSLSLKLQVFVSPSISVFSEFMNCQGVTMK